MAFMGYNVMRGMMQEGGNYCMGYNVMRGMMQEGGNYWLK
jgi:hypothetical protein